MQTKHTPGPWHIGVRTYHAGRDVYGPKGEPVAVADQDITLPEESAANARLIAAAPELLAALVALVGEADLGEVDLDDDDRAKLDAARAAIAKATGAT